MGDIDRIVPTPPAISPPTVARRPGDQRRENPYAGRDDVIDLENVESDEDSPPEARQPENGEDSGHLDLAV